MSDPQSWAIYVIAPKSGVGKRYVGQTTDPKRRWAEHQSEAKAALDPMTRRDAHPLHVAMSREPHTIKRLDTCESRLQALGAERHWVAKLGTLEPHGHNSLTRSLFPGAPGGPDWIHGEWFAERWDANRAPVLLHNGVEFKAGPGPYAPKQKPVYFARSGRRLDT